MSTEKKLYLKEMYAAIIRQTTPEENYYIWYRQDRVRGTLFEFFEKGLVIWNN